jgi:diguanylate cyclase (GGDEF)-like protein
MRKGRFAGLNDEGPGAARALSLGRLLLFDFQAAEDSYDERVAWERVRSLAWSAPFLTIAHLVCGAALVHGLLFTLPFHALLPVILPLVSLLLLDLRLWALTSRRNMADRRPHGVIRLTAAYAVLGAVLWATVIGIVAHIWVVAGSAEVAAALAGGMAATVAAFIAIPGLVVIACLAAVVASALFADPAMTAMIAFFGAMMCWLSLFRARDALLGAHRRMLADWQADRAGRFVAAFEQSGGGWFWETNAEGRLTYVSAPLVEAVGRPASDLIGRCFSDLVQPAAPGADGATGPSLAFHLSARFPFSELAVALEEGAEPAWSVSGRPDFDEFGRFLGFRGLGVKLTEGRRGEIEAQQLALVDSLTALPNRLAMRRMLDEALGNAAVRREGCSLFLIDLDRFKQVNDTLGHPVGDALLQEVADRMKAALGADGQVGRLGGDEFKAILPGIDEEGHLAALAERLIRAVTQPYVLRGHKVTIGASVGISIARPGRTYADALIKEADLALYAAKGAGRGTYRFFEAHMDAEAAERRILESDLASAVGRGQLRLSFQPIVSVDTEDLSGFEALVRWAHPTRGLLPPAEFVAIAESAGLIVGIGEWVLRAACAEAARWPAHLRLSVNVARAQVEHPGFAASLASALAASGLAPERLELDLADELLLGDGPDLLERLERLKALGIRLAIDDFGRNGTVSLRVAPVDRIKLHPSLVRSAQPEGSRSEAIVAGVVQVAHALGFDVVAEGIETLEELALTRRLNCGAVQGYLFGRPMDAEAAAALAGRSQRVSASEAAPARPARHSLIRRGALTVGKETQQVRLRNISAGGAMIESARPVEPGARVELDLAEGLVLPGEVRWAEQGRLGLKFDIAFDLQRLSARRDSGARVLKPDYLASDGSDSPWAGRRERLSIREVKSRG